MSEKWLCPTCGLHFDDEFEDTLKPECELWRMYNANELTREDKKKVWDWWFSAPGNYLAHKYNKFLMTQFAGLKDVRGGNEHGNQFAENVPRWNKMSDKEQREFQRRWHIWITRLNQGDGVGLYLVKEFARIDRMAQLVAKCLPKKKRKTFTNNVLIRSTSKKGRK